MPWTVPSIRTVPPGRIALLLFSLLAAAPVLAQEARSPEPADSKPAPASHRASTRPVPKTGAKEAGVAKPGDPLDSRQLMGLDWRSIGPYRGGRVTAVTGVVGQRNVYYFGGTGGGIWKSIDSGHSWKNVSDGQLATGSVGAVAVAASDPNVVYAGMGEGCIRGNVSAGDGVYRSSDAGRTWKHVGLADTRQIGRIRVDPRDPDRVYVAALGHAFGPNHQRGVFRTQDGGTTWQCVLFVSDSTGAIDLAMDPGNPRVLYAATWQVERTPWSLESGGAGSGLWKTLDGGDHWTRLTGEGLPKGPWGRVGVTVSPAATDRVWAAIEAAEGGIFRSDDAGRTWTRVNENRNLRQRAWYYTHVIAEPGNADALWALNVGCMHSKDGGRTFAPVATPHGDNHDLWIDPQDPQRMIEGNDGGACVSTDGGRSWTPLDNQPTGQFYHVVTDDGFPYRVYGAQQDNSTVGIVSRTKGFGIGVRDWYDVGGGESGFIAPKPGDPNIVYAGSYDGYLSRLDVRTQQLRDVDPYPDNPMGSGAEGAKYRFQWTYPIVISPHDPNTVYAGSNVLHRSTDEGSSWDVISPDLTRNDPKKLVSSGGPITQDNTSVEYYCTIFAMAESPIERGVLWVGSDDGLVHVSRDAGKTWKDVTPPQLPAWSMISQIDVGVHEPGTAFVAANRYKLDDDRPLAYVTHDWGKTWRAIAGDLPNDGGFVRVVREDPARKNLLFCGTERGVWFSVDAGSHWRPLRVARPELVKDPGDPQGDLEGALPLVPITDLVVKDDDLVVATQGRGFWILDHLGVLRQMNDEAARADAWLFTPGVADLFRGPRGNGDVGANPPAGACFDYRLAREPKPKEEIALEILDADGKSIRRFTNLKDEGSDDDAPAGPPDPDARPNRGGPRKLPAKVGLNRFVWDLRYPDAAHFKGLILWGGGLEGPEVVPGEYQVRLTAFGATQIRNFQVRKDPRLQTTAEDYAKRFELGKKIRDKLTETHEAIVRIRDVRDQLKAVADRAQTVSADTTLAAASRVLSKKLTTVEEALYQTKNASSQDPLNFPIRLNNKLSLLTGTVGDAESAPTAQSYAVYDDVSGKIDVQLATLKKLLSEDLAAFNRLVREKEVPAVIVKEKDKPAASAGPLVP